MSDDKKQEPKEGIDSGSWTGNREIPAEDVAAKTARIFKGRLITILALMVIVVGLETVFAINDVGIKAEVLTGKVLGVDFVPAHWVGRVWQPERWHVRVSLGREVGVVSFTAPPPDWATTGSYVTAAYGHGRIYADVIIKDLRPAFTP